MIIFKYPRLVCWGYFDSFDSEKLENNCRDLILGFIFQGISVDMQSGFNLVNGDVAKTWN